MAGGDGLPNLMFQVSSKPGTAGGSRAGAGDSDSRRLGLSRTGASAGAGSRSLRAVTAPVPGARRRSNAKGPAPISVFSPGQAAHAYAQDSQQGRFVNAAVEWLPPDDIRVQQLTEALMRPMHPPVESLQDSVNEATMILSACQDRRSTLSRGSTRHAQRPRTGLTQPQRKAFSGAPFSACVGSPHVHPILYTKQAAAPVHTRHTNPTAVFLHEHRAQKMSTNTLAAVHAFRLSQAHEHYERERDLFVSGAHLLTSGEVAEATGGPGDDGASEPGQTESWRPTSLEYTKVFAISDAERGHVRQLWSQAPALSPTPAMLARAQERAAHQEEAPDRQGAGGRRGGEVGGSGVGSPSSPLAGGTNLFSRRFGKDLVDAQLSRLQSTGARVARLRASADYGARGAGVGGVVSGDGFLRRRAHERKDEVCYEVGPEDAGPIEGWVGSFGARDLLAGGGGESPLPLVGNAFELGAGVVGGRVRMESPPKSPCHGLAKRRVSLKREPQCRAAAHSAKS